MAVNYKVLAKVLDIRHDVPQKSDAIFVDCNAWYWHTYSRASMRLKGPKPDQLQHYPQYLDAALEAGATIYCSNHSLTELCSLIERAEAEIYAKEHNLEDLPVKSFRHQPDAVIATYRKEIDSVWAQVRSMATYISQVWDGDLSQRLVERVGAERLDAYDALVLLLTEEHKITRILTDDGDFSTVSGLTVHTANQKVINAAMRFGKIEPSRSLVG